MLRLTIRVDGQEQAFETEASIITFGRAPENTIQVSDPKASRMHCRIEKTAQGWKVVDLESSNGTAVNGQTVNTKNLADGDRVSIGAFEVVINPPVAQPAAAPAPVPGRPRATPGSGVHKAIPQAHRIQAAAVQRENSDAMGMIKVGLLAAVLLVGVVFAINYFAGGGKAAEQKAQLNAALALAEKGDLDLAIKALENLTAGPMDSTVGRKAKESLETLRKQAADRNAAIAAKKAAAADAELAQARAAELGRLFDEITAAADALTSQEEYAQAIDAWKRFGMEVTEGKLYDRSLDRIKEIHGKAESAWNGLQERANRLIKDEQYEEAKALVTSSMDRFSGTRFYAEAQTKIAGIDRLAGSTAEYAAQGPALSVKTQDTLMTISDLVKARRYGDALKDFDRLLLYVTAEEKKDLQPRRNEIEAQATLFGKLIDAVNAGVFAAHPIDLGAGSKATLTKATNESLEVSFKDVEGKGGASSKKWHQVSGKDMLAYFEVLDLTTDDKLALASFCYSNSMAAEGGALLNQVLKSDPGREQVAFALIARHRGVAVPSTGFVWYESGWYTKSELQYARVDLEAKKGANLIAQVDAKKSAEGHAIYARLSSDSAMTAEFKKNLTDQYVKALKGRRAAILRQLQNSRSLVSSSVLSQLKKELNKRRSAAIDVIYDKEIYPDADHGKVGQPKVDEAVQAVRDLWENPLAVIGRLSTGISDLIKASTQTDQWLAELGASPSSSEQAEIAALLENVNSALSLKNYCLDSRDRSDLEYNRMVNAYNEKLSWLESQEKACVRATNEYREMMGRRALEAHELLTKAGRKHSQEMAEKNYFAHESPTPGLRTPGERAAKEGFSGGVGENIAMGHGDGVGAFKGWYNSSGHHRNMLSDRWNVIGLGRHGTHWTEMLANAPLQSGKEKIAVKKGGSSSGRNGTTGGTGDAGGNTGTTGLAGSGRRGGVTGGTSGGATSGGATSGGS